MALHWQREQEIQGDIFCLPSLAVYHKRKTGYFQFTAMKQPKKTKQERFHQFYTGQWQILVKGELPRRGYLYLLAFVLVELPDSRKSAARPCKTELGSECEIQRLPGAGGDMA